MNAPTWPNSKTRTPKSSAPRPWKQLLAVAVALLQPCVLPSQPAYVNYQGRLTDDQGQSLPNGQYAVEFNIYNHITAADGSNLIWGPFLCDGATGDGHSAQATLIGGRFNVILGPVDTVGRAINSAFQGNTRFLEVKVTGKPLLPRQQFLSAPFALQAGHAESATIAASLVQQLAEALCPAGSVTAFAGPPDRVPAGWLLCDGRAVASTNYSRLYAVIGTAWGNGEYGANNQPDNRPETDFNLPDLRGVFMRGANAGSTNALTIDPDAATRVASRPGGNTSGLVGSLQYDLFKLHNHGEGIYDKLLTAYATGANTTDGVDSTRGEPDIIHYGTLQAQGGNETRPKNAAVNYIIKY